MTQAITLPSDRDRTARLDAPGAGVLYLVIGPSGAGKDTLIDAARSRRPDILFTRRAITRPADAGGEDHIAMTEAEFEAAEAGGAFSVSWRAHGLAYGLPVAIEQALAEGRHVVANGSRRAIDAARARFPKRRVLLVTAATEVLAQRLAGRGRESAEAIAERLRGAGAFTIEGDDVVIVDNGGGLEEGVDAFLAALAAPSDQEPKR